MTGAPGGKAGKKDGICPHANLSPVCQPGISAAARGSTSYSTLNALMVYDSANDKVLLVSHSYHYAKPERLGVSVYDPDTNSWDAEPLALPEKLRNEQVKSDFHDPALNAVFLHVAGDSRDDGVIWAYRYKRPK